MTELSSYDPARPLLLVTAFAQGSRGGGAVILRSLLRGSESRVVWASLASDGSGYTGVTADLGGGNPWLLPPRVLASRIERLAERYSARAIWAVAHGALVPCLPVVARCASRRLHMSVHDDPAWGAAFRGRRELALVPWLHLQFGRALVCATSVDAIGGGMRAAIARRAGRDSVIVHRVVEQAIRRSEVRQETGRLTVGLLGSIYSPRQLEQLTTMLARVSEIIGFPTRLVVIGAVSRRLSDVRATGVKVEFLGHMDEREGLDVLASAFALYIGYPFGLRNRAIRRTSFPAKLATYVQAARPLLVHAPPDSSLTPLFALQPFALPWVDERPRRGAELLAAAWKSGRLHGSQHEAAETVRRTYFGADNRERLFEQLNRLVER